MLLSNQESNLVIFFLTASEMLVFDILEKLSVIEFHTNLESLLIVEAAFLVLD
jgi:hypothetical protein